MSKPEPLPRLELQRLPFRYCSLWRRGNTFKVTFYDPGPPRRSKQVTLRATTPGVAYNEAYRLAERRERGQFDPWRDRLRAAPLTSVIDAYLASNRERRLSPATVEQRAKLLGMLARRLPEGATVDEVTAEVLRAFVYSPPSAASHRTYYQQVKAFLRWAIDHRHLRVNPLAGVPVPPEPRVLPSYLSREQFAALLAAVETDLVLTRRPRLTYLPDLLRLGVASGLRRGELLCLRWQDVDFERGVLRVRGYTDRRRGYRFRPKWNSERDVPMFPVAEEVLRRRAGERRGEDDTETVFVSSIRRRDGERGPTRPFTRHHVTRLFNRYRSAAGLPETITLHSLRHTFATWLLADGVSMKRVQVWLGHRSIRQTEIYAHLTPEALRGDDVRVFDTQPLTHKVNHERSHEP